jgi:gliding motility-associated-like protein
LIRKVHIVIILLINITFGYGQVQLEPACAESTEAYGVSGYSDSEFIWSFDSQYGTVLDGNGTDTITIRWGYNTGTVQLEVLEVTSQNCSNFPSRATIEIMAPDVDLGYDFPEICEDDSLVLDAGNHYEPDFSILWHDGSTGQQYTGRNSEQIWVRVTDGFGCVRYDTVSLLVHPNPELNLGSDTLICDPGSSYVLRPGDFYYYRWTNSGTGEVVENEWEYYISPLESESPDTIILEVQDYNLCWATDTMVLYPCNYGALFGDIPNVITPDNDGSNDVWNIPHMQFFEDAVLEVFDRWGRLVFRTTNVFEEPWDGTSKGRDLPMDSYYFVLDLKAPGSTPIVGTVNIVR